MLFHYKIEMCWNMCTENFLIIRNLPPLNEYKIYNCTAKNEFSENMCWNRLRYSDRKVFYRLGLYPFCFKWWRKQINRRLINPMDTLLSATKFKPRMRVDKQKMKRSLYCSSSAKVGA